MNVRITPRRLSGNVTPPGSKSMAHRLLIAAALSSGVSVVEGVAVAQSVTPPENAQSADVAKGAQLVTPTEGAEGVAPSEDMEATLRCLAALGVTWEIRGNAYRVNGIGANPGLFQLYKQVVARLASFPRVPRNLSEQAAPPILRVSPTPGNLSEQISPRFDCDKSGSLRFDCDESDLSRFDCDTSGLPRFDCGESGSTLRFLIPVALAVTGGGVFTGRGRLMERPQTPYWNLFDEKGVSYERNGNALTVRGTLTPGLYRLPGDVSSQFFTGLLFALPLLDGESVLESVTPLQSAPYVRMTLDALALAGIRIGVDGARVGVDGKRIGVDDARVGVDDARVGVDDARVGVDDARVGVDGNRTDADGIRFTVRPQRYRAFRAAVETDWSQAAFWYAANFLGADVDIQGLNPDSAQGDKIIAPLSERLRRDGEIMIDVSDCPDLLPPLAVMSATRHGLTRFVNAGRLRMKESDRLSSVARMLSALGVHAEEGADFLNVTGGTLRGGVVDGANDHRIIMAAAIAASVCAEGVTITGADAVRKSYPAFWNDYQSLGGEIRAFCV